MRRGVWWLALASVSACAQSADPVKPQALALRVVAQTPHDQGAFTEGLTFSDGGLYESVGLNGASELRQVDLATGRVTRRVRLGAQYFGEGLTALKGRLYQLTWQTKVGFVYDEQTFKPLGTFTYPNEGWGLTTDGGRLIMSDGTDQLRFLDPTTLKVTGTLAVRDRGRPLTRINELEFMNGQLYANVWYSDWIARIDPRSGQVTAWIDARPLVQAARQAGVTDSNGVLNGIAFNAVSQRLYVTGKLWPTLSEVQIVPGSALPGVGGSSSLGD